MVNHIIAPFGETIESRAAVPTVEERLQRLTEKKQAKDERRRLRKAGEGVGKKINGQVGGDGLQEGVKV